MKKKLNTPEEQKHAELRDAIIKERPQEWDHIQKERQKIREKKASQALADAATINENKNSNKPKIVLSWAPHPKSLPHAVANSFINMYRLC